MCQFCLYCLAAIFLFCGLSYMGGVVEEDIALDRTRGGEGGQVCGLLDQRLEVVDNTVLLVATSQAVISSQGVISPRASWPACIWRRKALTMSSVNSSMEVSATRVSTVTSPCWITLSRSQRANR